MIVIVYNFVIYLCRFVYFFYRKCKEWERERRQRLSQSFFELSSLLPDHDPTLPLSKIDIITKATSYIKHLEEKNMNLMENDENSDIQSNIFVFTHGGYVCLCA